MRTLIYKRTHTGDPDPQTGVFGINDCLGEFRSWDFGAVIGIGGISDEPKRRGIGGKLTWIGIDPEKFVDDSPARGPRVKFSHFRDFEKHGPLLVKQYPALAKHMYETNRRYIIHEPSLTGELELNRDIEAILRLAESSPPSRGTEVREIWNKCYRQQVGRATGSTLRAPSKCKYLMIIRDRDIVRIVLLNAKQTRQRVLRLQADRRGRERNRASSMTVYRPNSVSPKQSMAANNRGPFRERRDGSIRTRTRPGTGRACRKTKSPKSLSSVRRSRFSRSA